MNRRDLAERVASRHGLHLTAADDMVQAVLAEIARAVAVGESVSVTGFGTWEVVDRAARVGRNPRTGERVAIGPSRRVKFRPGARLSGWVDDPGSVPDRVTFRDSPSVVSGRS